MKLSNFTYWCVFCLNCLNVQIKALCESITQMPLACSWKSDLVKSWAHHGYLLHRSLRNTMADVINCGGWGSGWLVWGKRGQNLQIAACKWHKKHHISTCRGCDNLGQRIFVYNSHTECWTFKNLVSPDSLNGAESLCYGHAHFCLESFFPKSQQLENLLFELLLGILSDLRKTWHVHSSATPDLKLSKEFSSVKKGTNY